MIIIAWRMAWINVGTLVGLCFVFCYSVSAKIGQNQDGFRQYVKRETDDKGLCQNPIDLLFILDSSESVGALNWEKVLNFTIKVALKFDVKYTRFGVIQFHSIPEVPIALTSFKDNKTLTDAIGSLFFKPGATRTDLAVFKAIEVFNKAPLRKASRVALFVIGGRSSDLFVSKGKSINATDLLKKPAADLQAAPVAVYAASVAAGLTAKENTVFKAELNILTSTPPFNHIFETTSYDNLLDAKPDEVAKKTCIVNGGMSPWSAWSTCSVTCGTGTRVRMRTCNNPKPDNGGLPCTENTVESGECSVQSCPGNASSIVPTLKPDNNTTTPPIPTNPTNTSIPSSNATIPSSNETVISINFTSPWSNASITLYPLPTNSTPTVSSSLPNATLIPTDKNATSPILPEYNLTSVVNKTITPSNGSTPGAGEIAPKPSEPAVPWPTTPASCKPSHAVVYGYPDYKVCGNGFEIITLSPHQLTASSTYSKDTGDKLIRSRHAPYNGLINNTQNAGAWCAEHQFAVSQDNNQYITIDLGQSTLIGKIATQGMEHWDNWVSTYALKYSSDNIQWSTYERTLQANCDRRTITENILNPPVHARFMRINPLSWHTSFDPAKHDICMRVGIYKCRDCKLVPLSRCQIAKHDSKN